MCDWKQPDCVISSRVAWLLEVATILLGIPSDEITMTSFRVEFVLRFVERSVRPLLLNYRIRPITFVRCFSETLRVTVSFQRTGVSFIRRSKKCCTGIEIRMNLCGRRTRILKKKRKKKMGINGRKSSLTRVSHLSDNPVFGGYRLTRDVE